MSAIIISVFLRRSSMVQSNDSGDRQKIDGAKFIQFGIKTIFGPILDDNRLKRKIPEILKGCPLYSLSSNHPEVFRRYRVLSFTSHSGVNISSCACDSLTHTVALAKYF